MNRTTKILSIACGLCLLGTAAARAQHIATTEGADRPAVAESGADSLAWRHPISVDSLAVNPQESPETLGLHDFDKEDFWADEEVTETPVPVKQRFLPMRRRIDREINRGRFAYKGELIAGLTASYGTLSSDDTEFLVILEHIDLNGTLATVKPFIGYFYRDNRCIGVRFGYEHLDGHLGNADFNLGEQNDLTFNINSLAMDNDSYSFALFHRSYVGLDPRGRFGLFAELEASAVLGSGRFSTNAEDPAKSTYSDNLRLKLAFNPGVAVYIFPNVCATVSLGLGGIQYNKVTQRDAAGNRTGSRSASKMRFRLNIADINFGMVLHFWDKKRP